MAKKKVEKTGELPSLLDMITSIDDKCEILSESQNAVIEDWISTGSYLLNACVSGSMLKGIASGKIMCYYGQSGSGKSFLSCAACREAVKKGYVVLYCDSEGAITDDFLKRIGVDTSKVIIRPVATITEVTQVLTNVLTKLEEQRAAGNPQKMMIVLDSLGNLSDDSDLEAAADGVTKANLQKNKLIKNLYRVVTPKCSATQTPFITISHSYSSLSLYGGNVISGGCLTPLTNVIVADERRVERIKDIKVGDMVLSYDGKFHEVLKTFNFKKEVIKFTFENDSIIECSTTHRFLTDITEPINDESSWTLAENLKIGDKVYKYENSELMQVEIANIEHLGELDVCDLTVEGTHSYITENGIVNHNSGIQYNASVMLELFPSKLVDKENDNAANATLGGESNVKNGITVTAKCTKNRFARPKKISLAIPFYKKINKYLGLEQYMTWENSKVCRGSMLTDAEWTKMGGDSKTVHSWELDGKTYHCIEKDTARGIVVAALGKQVSFAEFFTPEVFTEERLKQLDDEVIRPEFELPSQDSFEDITDIEDSLVVGGEINEED